jgi:succinyl-CoA synthetase alpha subunit
MSILITKDTTFIIQGITGREAVSMTRECLDFGSKVVGGVTPGRAGRDVYGVPVFDTVRDAMQHTRVDASVVAVPPAFTRDAVFEALDAGIKLIVVVTERIPRYEVAQMVELAQVKGCASSVPTASACSRPARRRSAAWAAAPKTRARRSPRGPSA